MSVANKNPCKDSFDIIKSIPYEMIPLSYTVVNSNVKLADFAFYRCIPLKLIVKKQEKNNLWTISYGHQR